jgi:NAD(P)-dependent dehydrogenase (short-subunit alcohol dehydrogenase family)
LISQLIIAYIHLTDQVKWGRRVDLDLTGRRALVTGSTQGIGRAVAARLAAEGASVVVHGRDAGRVARAVAELRREAAGPVEGIAADVADPAAVARLAEEAGPVDVLVNNVGVFGVGAFAETSDDDWQRYLDVNLMSGVRLSRALLPGMLASGWGRVVFVSSESGVDVPADMAAYGVTKAAQLALGNALAKTTRGTGVTVNTVLGGPTWSDGVAAAVTGLAQAQGLEVEQLRAAVAAQRPTSLVGRFLEPGEVADLVVYLCSPRASATNGAALRADGGVLTTTL